MTRRGAIQAMAGMAAASAAGITESSAEAATIAADSDRWRIVEARAGKGIRWRDLPGRLTANGVNAVFVGEQHDDPQTHRAEAALLEAVHRKVGDRLTLAMEMLERDQQAAVNDYLSGRTDEAAFTGAAKMWSNYATDYRPMVEYAKAKRIPVLASNAPQRIVRTVGREGLGALEKLTPPDRALVAEYVTAPTSDAYWKRFAEVMSGGHGSGDSSQKMDPAMVRRFYEAQALRDDTMAETVARAIGEGRVVYHVNGSFHSDAGLGTAARVLWRRPLDVRLAIVKIVPVKGDVAKADAGKYRDEADYLIFVPDERPAKAG